MVNLMRKSWRAGMLALLVLLAPAVAAQDGETLSDLASVLEDPGARRELIDALRAMAPDGGAGEERHAFLALGDLEKRMTALLGTLDDGREFARWIVGEMDAGAAWNETAWQGGVALVSGLLAWLAIRRLTAGLRRRLDDGDDGRWPERLFDCAVRLVLGIAPVAAFLLAAWVATLLLAPAPRTASVVLTAAAIVGLTGIVLVVIRVVLSPLRPAMRLVPLADREAAYLVVWLNRFSAAGIVGFLATDLLATMGAPAASVESLLRIVGLILAVMAVAVILQNRQGIAGRIAGQSGTRRHFVLRRLADVWHVVAILAVTVTFVVWVFEARRGASFLLNGLALTALAALGGALLSAAARRGLAGLFRIGADLRERFPDLERRSNRYLFLVGGLLNAVIWIAAAVVALEGWGIEAARIILSPDGLDLLGRLIAVVVVFVIAVIAWEIGDGIIAGQLRRSDGARLNPRVLTLLPLARNILLVVIGSVAFMMVLGELGLDVTPLLAGAGVIGLAVGFGAQSLIKDIITGAFILFENQFMVGDWIEAGGKMGGVENITVRTVQLRDLDGYVHTVPFGDISSVTNMMRGHGYAVIDVGVAYQENTDKVIGVVRRVDQEARGDPDLAQRLTGELEVLGVNALGDSSVTLRFRVRTRAGFQWGVRREYLRLLKLEFDRAGIEIPYPHMTVYFGEIRGGRTSPAHVRIDTGE